MGGKPLNNCRIYLINPRTWAGQGWTRDKIEAWVKNAGGKLQKEFDEQTTTHLVAEEQAWKNKVRHVQLALEANESGGRIHILSPEWLHTCLVEQRKCRERTYLWEKMEQEAAGEKQKKRKKKNGDGEGEDEDGEGARSHQAMLGEVLQEATEDYLEEHDRRALEAETAGIEKAKKEHEEEEARRKDREKKIEEEKRRARADDMKKSRKKGRGELFNENFHPWRDSTGFMYDIMLTKVDTLTNSNARLNLTFFESNNDPKTYATNLHFAGTSKRPTNNILAALGSNFLTAMRLFRNAFEEQTGVNWDDRIKAHNERVHNRHRDADTPGPHSTRRGENENIKSKTRAAEDEVPFEDRMFEYMPPLHAAKGWLPKHKEEVPEVLRQMRAKSKQQSDRTEEYVMSGVNGSGPEDLMMPALPSVEGSHVHTQVDLTEDDPADQFNASVASDSGEDLDGSVNGAGATMSKNEEAEANGVDEPFDVDGFLAGRHGWSADYDLYDAGDFTGQQQQDFVFDQNPAYPTEGSNAGVSNDDQVLEGGLQIEHEAPTTNDNADLQGNLTGYNASGTVGSILGQTQLATGIGEGLLNMEHPDATALTAIGEGEVPKSAVAGLVVVTESEQLEAAASLGKRKRDEDDTGETEPAAEEFGDEKFAT